MHPFLILAVGMAVVVGGILLLRLHAFLALLAGALVVAMLTPTASLYDYSLDRGDSMEVAEAFSRETAGERVARGFGRTTGQIGIIIAMASIIGICLLESGAADRLVRFTLGMTGAERAPLAFTAASFILAIPVFFDTVFYLMIPLAKATRLRTGKSYLLYVLAIVAGGAIAHSLVPPTPGPLFVAGEFGVDIGVMILGGLGVGLVGTTAGYLFACWADRRFSLPLRETKESLRQLKEIADRRTRDLPPVWLALVPILLPVLLITARTLALSIDMFQASGWEFALLSFLGEKNMALTLAALVAILTLLWKASRRSTLRAIEKAIRTAAVIILIIGAGGAFGAALQQTGIGDSIQYLAAEYKVAILPLAFLLTTLVRTAQGSATVAMITAAGTMIGIAQSGQLGFHPVYLALAIGCGSKPIWWMNDSGFWVVSQMSGMNEAEALANLTPLLAVMGVAGLLATMAAAYLFPLV